MIDWSATGAMLTGIGTIGSAVAIVGAAIVGRSALSDYKRQRISDKQIEAAEVAMIAAYKGQDAISGIRARWMPAAELQASEQYLTEFGIDLSGLSEADKKRAIERALLYRRSDFFKDDFDAIFEAIPVAKAAFGLEVAEALQSIPRARNRIISAADMLPMIDGNNAAPDKFAVDLRRDIYGSVEGEELDPTSKMVADAIAHLEARLLPIIRPIESTND